MKRLLLAVLCLLSAEVSATHIVGGEFEFLYRTTGSDGAFRYQIGMILYFDLLNGSPGARDPFVDIAIYRKRDHQLMRLIRLTLAQRSNVQYKRPDCASNEVIQTERIYYTYTIGGVRSNYLLSPAEFSDPEGYYLSWERCCRNYTITNVFSENPQGGASAIYAGQAFYLEFPPLRKEGAPFINSSPTLFPPLSDFACPERLYQVNFAGTDPDGDSLVYSMAVPLNTLTADALPPGGPRPGPYPPVRYRPQFSFNNPMNGLKELNISKDGVLSVIPSPLYTGLFVFAVKCEEFRDGVKIGEVRRDFQLLVLRNCDPSNKPVIEAKRKTDTQYVTNTLKVAWNNTTPDADRCIDIRVTDPDAARRNEEIEIIAVGVGFEDERLKDVLPTVSTTILSSSSSTANFNVCFPACPFTEDDNYFLDIVVLNDACGGAQMDTIRIDVSVEPPPNSPPSFNPGFVQQVVQEGGKTFVVDFVASDVDGDDLSLIPPARSVIDFPVYGFTVEQLSEVPGRITSRLTWNTECDKYDFSKRREFKFRFVVDDNDKCDRTPNDTLVFDLKRRINDFHDPVIEYVPDPTLEKVTIEKKIFETVNFNVRAYDKDEDVLILGGQGLGFQLATYGVSFPTTTFTGETTQPFNWYLDCSQIDLKKKDTFQFLLIVRDNQNFCGYDLADTLDVTVKVLPPDNNKPVVTANGEVNISSLALTLGEELNIPVIGTDTDNAPKDNLKLELLDVNGSVEPEGFTFTPVQGTSPVVSNLVWRPGCEIFQNKVYENEYQFRFRVTDSRCFSTKGDTVVFNLKVNDVENDPAAFKPINVITPDDANNLNDFFAMVALNEDGELVNILPKDNCRGAFVNIVIMNRWGREIFTSTNRDFRWYAEGQPSGVYYYVLKYTDREYKGSISVLGEEDSTTGR